MDGGSACGSSFQDAAALVLDPEEPLEPLVDDDSFEPDDFASDEDDDEEDDDAEDESPEPDELSLPDDPDDDFSGARLSVR